MSGRASEIAWAAQTWATELADLQPLVLVFEDIHWAEEPMLDLIEHLAGGVKDVPLLIVCLARADLLDERPAWGGGNVRATAIELEALPPRGQRAARRRRSRRASRPRSRTSSATRCSGRPRGTRCSSRRRCGCCSSRAASPRGSRTPSRR